MQDRRGLLLAGVVLALLLAPLDLARQLPVRDDPSRLAALLVDVIGVAVAAVGQLALVGVAAGARPARWLPDGTATTLRAVREHPRALLGGLLLAGAVSACITMPVSVAALGLGQVLGPLRGPSTSALLIATAGDAVGTALTAPYFALLAAGLAPARLRS